MRHWILSHLRGNLVGYLALFAALGGTSYAAVQLEPGSVRTQALAQGAVTHSKLAPHSVGGGNIINRSLTSADFKPGALLKGLRGDARHSGVNALRGPAGPAGATGPAGRDGSASIGLRARQTGAVTGTHGGSTAVPLDTGSWTQSPGELDFVAGSLTLHIPSSCTGSFGNSLVVSVDGTPTTFGVAPSNPAGGTVTLPLVVGTIMEPAAATQHTVTASFANSCTKAGEDYGVSNVKVDVVKIS